jgi:hypothetical protein
MIMISCKILFANLPKIYYNDVMLPEIEERIDFLKQVLLFNEFSDRELEQVAEQLKEDFLEAREVIFREGDEGDRMYFVLSGEVKITHKDQDDEDVFLALFDSGDTFGEDALFFNRRRSATVTARRDTELYYLDADDFTWLRMNFPQIEPYLVAVTQSHEIVRRLKINWLADDETISLVARRHPIRLFIEWTGMAFILVVVAIILLLFDLILGDSRLFRFFGFEVGGISMVITFFAALWSYLEWQNDYFFVTNLRVVWRERILLRSSSRQEVPLRTIQSLDVQTTNFLARVIGVGDLVIRTFNSVMRLTEVKEPDKMRNMIGAFLGKARRKSARAQRTAIRRSIRERVLGEEVPKDEDVFIPAIRQEKKSGFQLFKTRIVENDVITYRKHWFIFLQRAWKPTLALLLAVAVSIGFTLSTFNSGLGLKGLLLLYAIPFLVFLWWLYEYEDWRNDIYRVTKDRVIDRDKRPFGQESFRSAPIQNIQSVGHEVPNTIGLILNVGDVKINIGDETLTFDGVHDPAIVHQDISRRMEEHAAGVESSRTSQEHDRMATWLEIYHEELDRGKKENRR